MKKTILHLHTTLLAVTTAITALFGHTATPDVTGLTPSIHITFDQEAVVNHNGTGTLVLNGGGGDPSYVDSPNGMAVNLAEYVPWGDLTNATEANQSYTVSAFATLGANNNGIMWHLEGTADADQLIMRRGANEHQLIVTLGKNSDPLITLNDIRWGDHAYHHYALVITPDNMTLYVNGIDSGASTENATASVKARYQFGSRLGNPLAGEARFAGKLDDFRIYQQALSQSQIQTLFNALNSDAVDSGVISIKTGTRTPTAEGGNIWLFGTEPLGAVPVAATSWNKTPDTTETGALPSVISNLQNSAGVTTAAKLYYAMRNTWYTSSTANSPATALTKTYFGDATADSYTVIEDNNEVVLPDSGENRGWEVMLTGIPYAHADLYIYYAQGLALEAALSPPFLVKVDDAEWRSYYGASGLESTLTGTQNWRPLAFSTGSLREGDNFIRVPLSNLTPATSIAITHSAIAAQGRRAGLAGIQVAKRESAAPTSDDPYYYRSIGGNAVAWEAALWTHNNVDKQPWVDSSEESKTRAVLSMSNTSIASLPTGGVTAEALMIEGAGNFTLNGTDPLTFNGAAVLDAGNHGTAAHITLNVPVKAELLQVAANNPFAASLGRLALTSTASEYEILKLVRGTLSASSQLPTDAKLIMTDNSALMFVDNTTITNTIDLAGRVKWRVADDNKAEVSNLISGNAHIIKSGTGELTLSGGGSFDQFGWDTSSVINFAGTTPFTGRVISGDWGSLVTLNLAAPIALSGRIALGKAAVNLLNGELITEAISLNEGAGNNSVFIQSGGTFIILGSNNSNSANASIKFCHWAGNSSYTLTAGEFLATNAVAQIAWGGAGTMNIEGGRAYLKGINVNGRNNTATLNLNGGVLEVGNSGIYTGHTANDRIVKLGGGTLRAWDDFTFNANAVSDSVNVLADTTTTIDPAGNTIIWKAPTTIKGTLMVRDSNTDSGSGKLVLEGSVEVDQGGVLSLPAVTNSDDAVQADDLTLNGKLAISNLDAISDLGTTLVLLTSTTALPQGIESQVENLTQGWRAEIADEGHSLLVRRWLGTIMILR